MTDDFRRRLEEAARLLRVDWTEEDLRRGAERLKKALADRHLEGAPSEREPGWGGALKLNGRATTSGRC